MMPVQRRTFATVGSIAVALVAVSATSLRAVEPPLASREELVRRWDLNDDGAIDEGEAEVARSRMRRERAEVDMQAGLDPLTGKPRIMAADDAAGAKDEPKRSPLEDDQPPAAGRKKPETGLPGTRAPDVRPPIPSSRSGPAAGAGTVDDRPAAGRDARPGGGVSRQGAIRGGTSGTGGGIVTGGARAGGAARPGYGSTVPRPDLNAGRLPAGPPRRRPTPAGGGLLPRPRTAPVRPAPPPARRTVDDYDVY